MCAWGPYKCVIEDGKITLEIGVNHGGDRRLGDHKMKVIEDKSITTWNYGSYLSRSSKQFL